MTVSRSVMKPKFPPRTFVHRRSLVNDTLTTLSGVPQQGILQIFITSRTSLTSFPSSLTQMKCRWHPLPQTHLRSPHLPLSREDIVGRNTGKKASANPTKTRAIGQRSKTMSIVIHPANSRPRRQFLSVLLPRKIPYSPLEHPQILATTTKRTRVTSCSLTSWITTILKWVIHIHYHL